MSDDWKPRFRELYEAAQQRYRDGRATTTTIFEPDEVYFLATIGCSSRELFDFVEDSINWEDVEYDQVEGVTALRRDHFVNTLRGEPARTQIDPDKIPPKRMKSTALPGCLASSSRPAPNSLANCIPA